jgi:uncharacterized protein (DUF2235 family)
MSKRLVICCDGTWDTPDQVTKDGSAAPSNVTKLALEVADKGADGKEQLVFYHRGVGTSRWQHVAGGAFGYGLSQNVKATYRFIVENFAAGDELFLFGFSRGAFTARSTAGLVRNAGILKTQFADRIDDAYALYRRRTAAPRGIESQLFRRTYSRETRIRFIGVWDTVGALGIPIYGLPLVDAFNRRYQFHDTDLSTTVDAAFQALAIDEKRGPFRPAIWKQQPDAVDQQLEQVWFAGVHCNVGGGYPDTALSDIALLWMVGKARSCGLTFRPNAFPPVRAGVVTDNPCAVRPDPLGPARESRHGMYELIPPYDRPMGTDDPEHEYASDSAVVRDKNDGAYTPENLRTFLENGGRIASKT